jgi:hypothetical protein
MATFRCSTSKKARKPLVICPEWVHNYTQCLSPKIDRLAHVVDWTERNQPLIADIRKRLGATIAAGNLRYVRERWKTDSTFRLVCNLRSRTRAALKGKGKSAKTFRLIGCTIGALKFHLEAQFQPGMTWENYGQWHVDHILPCCSFDLASSEEQHKCFHYTNLQPLWARDNLSKNGRIPTPQRKRR